MHTNPTLDVVIPCYNAARTLLTAVESAAAQRDVRNIWLVDDASTDNTRDVMRNLTMAFPQVRCEYMPQNGGSAKARNWGALQSDADFVAFLDADDAYETGVLTPAYMALEQFHYLSLVRLKLRPVGFPARYLDHPEFPRAWQRLAMTVGGNTVFRRCILLAAGGFPQDGLFRQFGGEDAALGIALTRSSVVGTLFGSEDAAVQHVYRDGIHAERLLDAELFGQTFADITPEHAAQAEAVTAKICRRLDEMKAHSAFDQTGITALEAGYEAV
ncbi:glycosyltransferase family 2 protein [Neisseria chenwenguii]|uniref:Glycosyltransferase n=1 Tax=Neisseria chenwenguii TaxID=1853278 RepID=A0A220S3D5_9NEIS|nr:glycosyltransferase family 2 protein [Neisseria chenwenguii]ASK27715.1 glycosyltransferase [Neisseria chenwenguii]ROV55668.1 glycosyltransferase family 2 protein [Neisseria chenwenguii]